MSLYRWLFVFFVTCFVLTSSGRISGGDAGTMYQVTHNMAAHGTVSVVGRDVVIPPQTYPGFLPSRPYTVETSVTSPGLAGRTYSPYGWGQSLSALPLYSLGQILDFIWPGMGPQFLARLCLQLLNAVCLAATAVLLVEFSRSLGFGLKVGLGVGLAFAFGTMVWPHVKGFYGEPGTAFCLLWAAYALHRFRQTAKRNWAFWAGLAFGASVVFRITSLIAILALGTYLLLILRERWRHVGCWDVSAVVAFALGCVPGAVIVVQYNLLRFGQPIVVSYSASRIGWETPVLNGLYGLLFSPGKGFFIYNLVLLLGLGGMLVLGQRHRGLTWMIVLISATYVLFHAPYSFWTGGWNWGPRFLIPIIPFLMLPVGALLQEAKGRTALWVFVLLVVLGVVVQLPAVLVNHSRDMIALSDHDEGFYDKTVYDLALSPVVRQWPVALDVLERFTHGEAWSEARGVLTDSRASWARADVPDDETMAKLTEESEFIRNNVPDFWWVYLYLLGVSPFVAFGTALALVGIGGIAAFKIIRLAAVESRPTETSTTV